MTNISSARHKVQGNVLCMTNDNLPVISFRVKHANKERKVNYAILRYAILRNDEYNFNDQFFRLWVRRL